MSIATHCLMAHKHCAEQNVSLVTRSMYYNTTGDAYSYCALSSGCDAGQMEGTLRKNEKYQERVQNVGGKY